MEQNAIGRWQAEGGLQVPSGICSLSVLESYMKYCLYLFLCMAGRQCLEGEGEMDRVPNARIRELREVKKGDR